MTMRFAYRARTFDGAAVDGTLAAESRAEALEMLGSRSLAATSIVRCDSLRDLRERFGGASRGLDASRVGVLRAIAAMTSAGVPVGRAIESSAPDVTPTGFRAALYCIAEDLERGSRLSAAVAKFPREFPEVVRALVRAGEIGGDLPQALQRAADLLDRGYRLRRQIFASLTYPAIVVAIAGALVLFLMVAVVPELATTLRGLGAGLPLPTAALLRVSEALRDPAGLSLFGLALAGAVAAAAAARRLPSVAAALDRMLLRAPIVGIIVRRAEIACCARTLAMLLATGVSMREALQTSASATGSIALRACFAGVADAVALGQRIAPEFAQCGWFEPVFVSVARAGEESGTLDVLLARVSEHLDEEARRAASTLASAIEPLLIIVLGAAIGGIVAAVLIPLYSAIGSIA